MINILLPMAAKQDVSDPSGISIRRQLIEIGDKAIIERVVDNYAPINIEKRFIFVIRGDDVARWHLDKTLLLLAKDCEIIPVLGETKGAACTALVAIQSINNDSPLIIANTDQLIDVSFDQVLQSFETEGADAGVITFPSVHPRWSYALTDSHNNVLEAAEKSPISRNAIAGFYYFRRGRDFVDAAMSSIYKDTNVGGQYFIAPTLNEMILKQKKVVSFAIESRDFYPLHSQKKIDECEAFLSSKKLRS